LVSSATTATELGYLSGVTSALQAQLDGKQATITTLGVANGGTGATTLTANKVLVGGASAISAVTSLSWDSGNSRLGIGSSAPSQVLDVAGTVKATAFQGDGSQLTGVTSTVSGTVGVANGGTGVSTLTASNLLVGNGSLAVTSASGLTWDSGNSRLGVGSSAPSVTVDVVGTGSFRSGTTVGTNDAGISIGSLLSGTTPYIGDNASAASTGMVLRTKNVNRMQIDQYGHTTFPGTISPVTTLAQSKTIVDPIYSSLNPAMTLIDTSTNYASITTNGTITTTSFSPEGTLMSAKFPGSVGNYLTFASGTAVAINNIFNADFTLETYVYYTAWPTTFNFPNLIGSMQPTSVSCAWSFGIQSTSATVRNLCFYYFNGAVQNGLISSTTSFALNTWYHLAASYVKTSNTIKLFVNGVQVFSGSPTGTITAGTDQVTIGQYNNDYFSGYVAQLRFIIGTSLYSGTFTPAPATNVANTKLLLDISKTPSSVPALSVSLGGTVGIATSAPSTSYKLDVTGGIHSTASTWITDNTLTTGNSISLILGKSPANNGDVGLIQYNYVGTNATNSIGLGFWGGNNRMVVTTAGYVGIGTTTPSYPLHITNNGGSYTWPSSGYYMSTATNSTSGAAGGSSPNNAILASGAITTNTGFYASSDSRIKNELPTDINIASIDDLRVVEFDYVDKLKHSQVKQIGFIAQEVRAVVPDAVQLRKDIVPDIFKLAKVTNGNEISLQNHGMVPDTRICVMLDEADENGCMVTVDQVLDADTFTIVETDTKFKDQVFVYGREVDDYHELNHNYIFSLSIAAIQNLRSNVKTLNNKLATMQVDLDSIKAMLNL
jgi:hypothetical protein